MKAWIVWNESRTEGVIFTDEDDATITSKGTDALYHRGMNGFATPALGEAFAGMYDEDNLKLEEIEVGLDQE